MKAGCIYFVTDGEAVKIGFASDLKSRLRILQVSHHIPLFLLGAIAGTRDDEAVLHARFDHLRLKGEWFRPAPELTQAIDGFEDAGLFIDSEQIEHYAARMAACT